ncbi:MAG TPA: hypothetical protein VHM25_08570 [Polyangiaceae bacterium]|nr:hypothetical protein [Polyangiaceae bacterium]
MFKWSSLWALAFAVSVGACGARFSAHESDGALAGNAGDTSGGFTSSAGSSSVADAGESEAGGNRSTGLGGTGAGGTTGSSGGRNWGNGGRGSGNGGASAADCATLRQTYQTSIEAARVCDKGSIGQCSPSSVAQPVDGCGCPVLINTQGAAADATREAYQAYLDGKCESHGPICDIACPKLATASCSQSGPSGSLVCVGDSLLK